MAAETLKEAIERIVPYVLSTVSDNNLLPSDRDGWALVHKGRAKSSVNQLEQLLKLAEESDS